MPALSLRLGAALFALVPLSAQAHIGLEPQSVDLLHPPGESLPLDLESTFALFRSDDGVQWRFTCHEALLADPNVVSDQLPRYVRATGALLVAQRALGLGFASDVDVYRSTDGGCDWSAVSGLTNHTIADLAVLSDGTSVIAGSSDQGTTNGLYYSTDAGADFDDSDAVAIDGLVLSVAAGPGQTAWATSLNQSGGQIWRSTDGGATWGSFPFLFDAETGSPENLTLPMADPTDPLVAWVRAAGVQFDYIYRTNDGGENFTEVFREARSIDDGQVTGDAVMLAVSGGRPASSADGEAFGIVSELPVTEGIANPPSGVFLATARTEDFAIARLDNGSATALMGFGDVTEELSCPAGTRHAQVCSAIWPDALAVLEFARNDDDDAADDDDASGDDDDAKGCTLAEGPSLGWLLLPLVLARRRRQ